MEEKNDKKLVKFFKAFFRALKPKFSFHYVIYTILFLAVSFSVVQLIRSAQATTPNPGHPWNELGNGNFAVNDNSFTAARTFTLPDASATILTNNALVTVGQGGTGANTLTGVLLGNGTSAFTALALTSGQSIRMNAGGTAYEGFTPGSGTVTGVSVVSTNGFAGSSSGGATPALTLSTTVSGMLKGNATAISAATDGTDFLSPSTGWKLNGQTLGAKKTLGSTDAYDIGFLANNIERMTILSGGNVGIGTTNPIFLLDVRKNQAGYTLVNVDNNNTAASGTGEGYSISEGGTIVSALREERDTTGILNLINGGNGQINFQTGSSYALATPKMTILVGGNVGVGTTSPSTLFHIQKDQNAATALFIGNANVGSGAKTKLSFGTAGTEYSYLEMDRNSNRLTLANTNPSVADIYLTPGTGGNLIVNSGNVGIGATSPSFSYGGGLNIYNATWSELSLSSGGGTSKGFLANYGDSTSGMLIGTSGSSPLRILTNGSEAMRVTSGGNVGIGTTTPVAKLYVAGSSYIEGGDGDANLSTTISGLDALYDKLFFTGGTTLTAEQYAHGNVTGNGTMTLYDSDLIQWMVSNSTSLSAANKLIVKSNLGKVAYPKMISVSSSLSNVDYGYGFIPSAAKETMTISSLGNVGIWSTAPTSNLQVSQGTAGMGTVAVSGTSVTGTGTQFTNTFKAGDTITVTTTSGAETKAITTITSDTALVTAAFSGTASAGTTYTLAGGDIFAVKGNGNVGIGTTSPAYKLDVSGDYIHSDTGFKINNGNYWNSSGYLRSTRYYFDANSWLSTSVAGSDTLGIFTGGSEKVTVLSGGNVGIGTTSPSGKLNIDATSGNILNLTNSATSEFSVSSAGVVTVPGLSTAGVVTNTSGGVLGTSTVASLFGSISGVTGTGTLNYVPKFTSTGSTIGNSLIFDNGTNVGIGTTSPGRLLEVYGAGNQILVNSTTGAGNSEIGFATTGTLKWRTGYGVSLSSGEYEIYNSTNSVARFVIQQGGNVGIGTVSPIEKLQVSGAIVATGANTTLLANSARISEEAGSNATFLSLGANSSTKGQMSLSIANSDYTGYLSPVKIYTNGDIGLVTTQGNVGIGTTAPSRKLHVLGGATWLEPNSDGTEATTLSMGRHYDGDSPILDITTSDVTNARVKFTYNRYIGQYDFNYSGPGNSRGVTIYDNYTTGGELQVFDQTDTQKVSIKGNGSSYFTGGNVGIGMTGPNQKLAVEVATNKRLGIQDVTSSAITDFLTGDAGIQFSRNSDGSDRLSGIFGYESSTNSNIAIASRGNIVFASGGSSEFSASPEIMRITPTGYVGIGTTNPAAKLHLVLDGTGGGVNVDSYNSAAASKGNYILRRARGSYASPTNVLAGDTLGSLNYFGAYNNGSAGAYSSSSQAGVFAFAEENFSSATNMGTYLVFRTTPTASGTQQESMRVTGSGNVGIGMAPTYKLDLTSGISGDGFRVNNTLGGSTYIATVLSGSTTGTVTGQSYEGKIFSSNNNVLAIGTADNVPLKLFTNNTVAMTILGNGNVGIGASPTSPLTVVGAAATYPVLQLSSSQSGNAGWVTAFAPYVNVSSDTSGSFYTTWGTHYNGSTHAWVRDYMGALPSTGYGINTSGDFFIQGDPSTAAGVPSYSNLVTVKNSGNVGIGTASPNTKLDVRGVGSFDNGDATALFVGDSTVTTGSKHFLIGMNKTSNYGTIQAVNEGTAYLPITLNPNGGNVGIGTISPTARLHIRTDDASLQNSLVLQTSTGAGGDINGNSISWKLGIEGTNAYEASYIRTTLPSGYGGTLTFATNDDQTGNAIERMRIDKAGNVGIGTTTPASPLSVFRAATHDVLRVTADHGYRAYSIWETGLSNPDFYNIGNALWFGSGSATVDTGFYRSAAHEMTLDGNGTTGNLVVTGNSSVGGSLTIASGNNLYWGNYGTEWIYGNAGIHEIAIGTNSTPAVHVRADQSTIFDGNVGIKTQNPGQSLTVGGDLSSTEKQGFVSTDNVLLASLHGGLHLGKVGLTENQWGTNNNGINWTRADSPTRHWFSVAMSSDGKIQTAVANRNDYIYYSTDYGASWNLSTSPRISWISVAMSSDGKIQTAVADNDYIYYSNDYGVTWTQSSSNQMSWTSVAMSSDGRIQSATADNDYIYYSTDYGQSWSQSGPSSNWRSVAMSSDGKIQTAVSYSNYIYYSSDYGASWNQASSSYLNWTSVAMSSDGRIQSATADNDYIYYSTDYGASWNQSSSASIYWRSVAMSSDGKIQTAVADNDYIYYSNDYGVTWTQSSSNQMSWTSVAMSSDGKIQTAVADGDYIYYSYSDSYINGNVGVGVASPTAFLHLGAGSAITGGAPLKFSVGGLLSTPENGAMEYNGGHFYATIGSNRYQLDQQSGITPWDQIGDPTGAGSIAFGSTVQTMDWAGATTQNALSITGSSLTSGKLLSITSNSLSSGALLNISSNGTGGLTNQTGLNIALSGTNSNSTQTTYGAYISNAHAGTASTNVGLYVSATNGTTANYTAIFAGGNVGIGEPTPSYRLSVADAPSANTPVVSIVNKTSGTTANAGLAISAGNNTGVNASKMITFLRPDNTVIGTISQNAATTVAYNTSSDRRIKNNITPTVYTIDDLLKIQVNDFNFINDPSGPKMTGFIAQDLETIFPGAVTTNGDNGTDSLDPSAVPWMIDYGRITPLIVKSIQDLDLKIKDLETTGPSSFGEYASAFFTDVVVKVENGIVYMKGLAVETLKIGSPDKRTGVTLYDEVTGDPYCLSIANGSTKTAQGECGVITPPAPVVTTPPTVVEDNSNNNVDTTDQSAAVINSQPNTGNTDTSAPISTSDSTSTSTPVSAPAPTPDTISNDNIQN